MINVLRTVVQKFFNITSIRRNRENNFGSNRKICDLVHMEVKKKKEACVGGAIAMLRRGALMG
jgi:hypothetical protein